MCLCDGLCADVPGEGQCHWTGCPAGQQRRWSRSVGRPSAWCPDTLPGLFHKETICKNRWMMVTLWIWEIITLAQSSMVHWRIECVLNQNTVQFREAKWHQIFSLVFRKKKKNKYKINNKTKYQAKKPFELIFVLVKQHFDAFSENKVILLLR